MTQRDDDALRAEEMLRLNRQLERLVVAAERLAALLERDRVGDEFRRQQRAIEQRAVGTDPPQAREFLPLSGMSRRRR